MLRGPLFGISDPELFEYKQSGGWFSIFAPENVGSPTPRFALEVPLTPRTGPSEPPDNGPRSAPR